MNEALIAAGASILSNIILTNRSSREIDHKLETHQAIRNFQHANGCAVDGEVGGGAVDQPKGNQKPIIHE